MESIIKNKSILITGAGGFIGSHLARKLLMAGNFVRGVDIKWNGYISEPCCSEKFTLDMRNYGNCGRMTEGMDYVFHLAANMGGVGFITDTASDIVHDNTLMNIMMARACAENRVRRVFFSSSACVYPLHKQGSADVEPLKEEDAYPAEPDTFYGWEKLYSEKVFAAFRKDHDLDVRIARYHNVYGPEGTYSGGREKSPAALCRKVIEASDPGEIEIWGDGKQTRSYCYIDDCLKGTMLLMESAYDEPLNIGSDRLVTIDALADIIIKLSGKAITKRYDLLAPQGVRGRNSDNTKALKVLGWKPQTPLEKGLEATYRWMCLEIRRHTMQANTA